MTIPKFDGNYPDPRKDGIFFKIIFVLFVLFWFIVCIVSLFALGSFRLP